MKTAIHNVSPKLRGFIAAASGQRTGAAVTREEFDALEEKVDALFAEIDELFSRENLSAAISEALAPLLEKDAETDGSKVANRGRQPRIADRFKLPTGDDKSARASIGGFKLPEAE
ncbi:hypothetical protein AAG604_12120 [Citromicrobium bathyomarinum]